jgi:hypothetical protein
MVEHVQMCAYVAYGTNLIRVLACTYTCSRSKAEESKDMLESSLYNRNPKSNSCSLSGEIEGS